MLGKVFFLVCIVTLLSPNYSSAALKERNFDPRAALQDVLARIQTTNVQAELFAHVFPNAEETVSTLSNVLTSGQKPNISVILDIFNLNFGRRLLIVNQEYLEVDPWAVQGLISDRVMPFVKSFRSNSLVRQMAVEGVFQRQIQRAVEESTPFIEARKMPIERMTALISLDDSRITKRDSIEDVLLNVLFTFINSLCTNVVSLAYSYVNTTLIGVVDFLESVSVGGDNALIGSVVTLAVNVSVEIVEGVNEILSTVASSICSNIANITTRKRRDLSAFDMLNRVAANEIMTRDVALGTIIVELWEYIWYGITGAIGAVVSTIWNLLFGWL